MVARNGNVELHEKAQQGESDIHAQRAEFAARLKALRLSTGMTLEAFAALCEVGKRSQSSYEDGSRAPDVDYLTALHRGLGVDVQQLVTGEARQKLRDLSAVEIDLVERLRSLSPKLRRTVDDVVLMAWLAQRDRPNYPD